MELAEDGEDGLRPEREDAGAAGVEPAGGGALDHQRRRRPGGRERGLGVGARVVEVDRAAGPVRVARRARAGPHPGGEQHLLAGLAAREGLADLEEREVVEAAGLVARGRAQQAGQQVGPHVAHLGADRVVEAHRLARPAEEFGRGPVDEAVGHALVVAERRDPPPHLPLAALHRREDRPRHARRTGQRLALDLRQRGDAGDLLDEIGLAADVGAPARHADGADAGRIRLARREAERRQDPHLLRRRDLDAEEAHDAGRVEAVAPRRLRHRAGDLDLGGLAAAEVEDHPGRELDPRRGEGRVDAALETVAGVGVDLQAAAGARRADRIEVGGLDEDVDRLLGAAGAQAAHDPADRLRSVLVADDGLGAVEGIVLAVERGEMLALPGEPDGDRAMDLVGVEDVERPVAVEGDEVGDVDERRDRPEADGAQPVLEPVRRRAVADAADQAADEERTGLAGDVGGEVDADRTGEGAGHGLDGGRPERAEAAGGEVAGDAGDAEGVGAVRGDGDVEDGVEGHDVDVAGADGGVGRQLDDAGVGVGELHLALGEHHAVALDAADLADLDRRVDAGDVVAGLRDHDLDAGAGVRGAADDLLLAVDGHHPADAELVGVGVRARLEHLADGEGGEPLGRVGHALDLEAEVDQREGDLVERGARLEMLLQPGEGELHGSAAATRVGWAAV